MKMTTFKKALSFVLLIVLIAAIALCTIGCNGNKDLGEDNTENPSSSQSSGVGKTVKGEGATVFDFTVVDKDGKETAFEIHTDKKTVGEALLELGLIAGEQSTYGLYVKTVNGETLDYGTDKMYWSFYENGKYAMSGVDTTNIVVGTKYEFRAEKA